MTSGETSVSSTASEETAALRPVPTVAGTAPYEVPERPADTVLRLDGNEGALPPAELLELVSELGPAALRDYPSGRELESQLAARFDIDPRRVLVTAGADDALDRACRAVLGPGRELVLPVPTFEMLQRYPRLVGADLRTVPWPGGPYPTDQVIGAVSPRTRCVAVVTPNNPTGAIATAEDLRRISAATPRALLVADLAYTEFADQDLTGAALALPNALVVRTFSKAWGLAGLRVGYALGPEAVIRWLRAVGSPYPNSTLSLALATRQLATGAGRMHAFVARVRAERSRLTTLLESRGVGVLPSQANFILARFRDARGVWGGLHTHGIAVRRFPDHAELGDALRITCPGSADDFARLCTALDAVHDSDPTAFGPRKDGA